MTEIFTSKDARLRPRPGMYAPSDDGMLDLEVTPLSFPELYHAFARMRANAGAEPYRLYVDYNMFYPAWTLYDSRSISITPYLLNHASFEQVVAALGHELGHAYRFDHPTQLMPAHVPASQYDWLNLRQRSENDADMLSVCWGAKNSAMESFLKHAHGVPNPNYPPIPERIAVLKAMEVSDCPHPHDEAFAMQPVHLPMPDRKKPTLSGGLLR